MQLVTRMRNGRTLSFHYIYIVVLTELPSSQLPLRRAIAQSWQKNAAALTILDFKFELFVVCQRGNRSTYISKMVVSFAWG